MSDDFITIAEADYRNRQFEKHLSLTFEREPSRYQIQSDFFGSSFRRSVFQKKKLRKNTVQQKRLT